MNEQKIISIGWDTLFRVALFVGVIYLLFVARGVVGLFLVALVVSIGFDRVVSFGEKKRVPRLVSTILAFLTGVTILGAVLYYIVPVAINEVINFLAYLNTIFSSYFKIHFPELSLESLQGSVGGTLGWLGAAGISITGAIGSAFIQSLLAIAAVMSAFYLTLEKDGPERFLKSVLPIAYERGALEIYTNFKNKISTWFFTQLFMSSMVGMLTGIGLTVIGVRYPFAIGLLAAMLELVPMVGPAIVGVVIFLIALPDSAMMGVYALAYYTIIEQLQSNVVIPYVMGRAVRVHPLLVVLSFLVGSQVAGLVGVILAVPIAVMIQEVFEYIANHKSS